MSHIEPTAATVDPQIREQCIAELHDIRRRGAVIAFDITHKDTGERLCDFMLHPDGKNHSLWIRFTGEEAFDLSLSERCRVTEAKRNGKSILRPEGDAAVDRLVNTIREGHSVAG